MTMAHATCTDCGTKVDITNETSDSRIVCPNCGGTKRNIALASSGPGNPTNFFLDKSVANKLSSLTSCGAPELKPHANWLGAFILQELIGITYAPSTRAYLFNYLRRTIGAHSTYQSARSALIRHLNSPRNHTSAYFESLLYFEVCVSQYYQGYEFLMAMSGEKLFDPKVLSPEKSLHNLYITSKHMDKKITEGNIPSGATSGIWIQNDGLETNDAKLTFLELSKLLDDMSELADKIIAAAHAPN